MIGMFLSSIYSPANGERTANRSSILGTKRTKRTRIRTSTGARTRRTRRIRSTTLRTRTLRTNVVIAGAVGSMGIMADMVDMGIRLSDCLVSWFEGIVVLCVWFEFYFLCFF